MTRVIVKALADQRYSVVASDGRHAFVADESEDEGGDGLGSSPHEILLASLGACTAITLRMYAERKQWPLQDVSVHLTHEKVSVADCSDCSPEDLAGADADGRIDRIESHISVRGDLSDEQSERLLEIAERCPVHRLLERRPKIVSTIRAQS